jgi:predicted Fe-Mo cluster-binding NifX family protein
MKIAVSIETNNGLDSVVAHHFGRCPFFALVEVEENEIKTVEVINNPYFNGHQPGQVPGFIHQQNADVMLSGGMGGRAIQFFQQFGIQAATGANGTVQTALESFFGGKLSAAAPCKESVEHGHGHHGDHNH